MSCELLEAGKKPDFDVVTSFDKGTGEFRIFTEDAYVYHGEDLHMSIECRSDLTKSTVRDEVVVQLRKPIRRAVREGTIAEKRRRLQQSSNPADWQIRWPDCQPQLSTAGINIPSDQRYLIGVDGDYYMDPVPEFTMNPTCDGLENLKIDYWATQRNGLPLPESVFFYPDNR